MGLEGQEPNSRGPLKAQLRDVAGVGGDQVPSRRRNGVRAAVGCLRPEGSQKCSWVTLLKAL